MPNSGFVFWHTYLLASDFSKFQILLRPGYNLNYLPNVNFRFLTVVTATASEGPRFVNFFSYISLPTTVLHNMMNQKLQSLSLSIVFFRLSLIADNSIFQCHAADAQKHSKLHNNFNNSQQHTNRLNPSESLNLNFICPPSLHHLSKHPLPAAWRPPEKLNR